MQEKTRIGFFGAGYSAGRHLDALLTFEDAQVVAVIDSDRERAREFATRCGGTPYGRAEEMLDRERLDAIYICVPPFAHGLPEAAAVERGLPFFVEKPLAVDRAKAEAIAARVAAEGLVTATGYHWRYLDTTERAQELVSQNPARLALGYWLDVVPPTPWWVSEALSGGQIVEQLTHILDLARLLVGEVERVYAVSTRTGSTELPDVDVRDVSAATLHFTTGAIGTMASTCLLNWRHVVGLHLICEGMVIELSEYDMVIDVGQGRPVRQVEVNAFAREDRDFIDAVRGKPNRIRVPYAEALTTHRLAFAVAEAARDGHARELRPEAGYA